MPDFRALTDPKAYHILSYGTLLGATVFQTFVGGPVAFKALPRPSFATLQTAVIPVFFSIQTALPVALALSWPGQRIVEAADAIAVHKNAGLLGLLEKENTWSALLPIAVMFGTALVNLTVFGPSTTKVMRERKHQGT